MNNIMVLSNFTGCIRFIYRYLFSIQYSEKKRGRLKESCGISLIKFWVCSISTLGTGEYVLGGGKFVPIRFSFFS